MPHDVPDGRPGRRRRPLLLAGTALAAVTMGTGVALAATSGPSRFPSLSAGPPGTFGAVASAPGSSAPGSSVPGSSVPGSSVTAPRFARPGCLGVVTPRRAGLLCRRPGLPGVLHGTLVLPKSGGGTVTVEIQNGRVTSVSRSSVTLRSQDGYTRTYAVTSSTIVDARRDGIGSVTIGDQAWVLARASGGTVIAIRVRDLSQLLAGPGNLSDPAGQAAVPAARAGSAASFFGGLPGG